MCQPLFCSVFTFFLVAGLLALSAPKTLAQSYTTARLADGFDYPVGKPDARGYYVYRGYYPGGHLGEDWNGDGGGNTDEGDPVYSIAHGVVVFSQDYKRGWGNVVIVRHAYRAKNGQINYIDSLYGHLKVRLVREGEQVIRGQQLGTIGTGPYRMYTAHLHFEIRKDLRVGMRRDLYSKGYSTYHHPRNFMDAHRRLRYESRMVRVPINTFLKSNPNQVLTTAVEVPEVTTSTTVRPVVPPTVRSVIEAETNSDTVEPEDSRNLFQRLFQRSD
ncbi:MAG: M23 family metallopeptidase [Verrucomicrobiota bacterium]